MVRPIVAAGTEVRDSAVSFEPRPRPVYQNVRARSSELEAGLPRLSIQPISIDRENFNRSILTLS